MVIKKQIGVTLIELTVVLLVLVALAGVVIPYVGGTSSTALCNATDVTMQNVKKVIMERYYLDTLGKFPQNLQGLAPSTTTPIDYNLHYLFSNNNVPVPPSTTPTNTTNLFDPVTQTGWHGAYLQGGFTLDGQYIDGDISNGELASNLKDSSGTYVHTAFVAGNFIVNDAWGRPIILQVDCSTIMGCARLVSAGAGKGLAIGEADIETSINAHNRPIDSDDRVLYLNAPTPFNDVNPPCNES